MWFAFLGHLTVRGADGVDVPVPGPARRQLLAALLCRAGTAVTASTLVEDLWGAAPPRSAVNSLRSHAARLRADLAQGGQEHLLVTEGDGYRLAIAASDVDAGRFEDLVVQAGALADDPADAVAHYDEALRLWRDEPYVEFGDAPFAVLERIRLAELRAQARERRTELALSTGLAGELVGELEQRVRAEPYRERGWEQLALALYRAGRQADALATCRRVRELLLDDLGVDPGPGLQALEQRLLRQDPDLLANRPPPAPVRLAIDRCPYLGLAGYNEQDAALFVGRERLTSTLAGRLADQSVVLVMGASGVGKSSLVRAGLVPALRAGALPGSAAWRIDIRTPFGAFDPASDRRPDLVVLDQAEEIFTGLTPDERDDLMTGLTRYIDDGGRLVVVLRSDFYGRLATLDVLAPFAEKVALLVGPMRADELRRALVEPATAAGLRLEDELLETVMEAVGDQPEPLPLLSEAMVRTWQRRNGNVLTLEAYRRAGELAGALEAAAEECYAGLDEPEQRSARHLLVRLATHTDTGWARRPIAPGGRFDDDERQALDALIAARLVVTDERRIEITHEALLTHWPRLRDWLEERSLGAELLQHLDQSAGDWRSGGRQPTDLYRGPRLASALDWRAQHPGDLSAGELEFLDVSLHAADAELATARGQARRFRTVALVLAVVVAVAVAATVLAYSERGSARKQAHHAEAAALAADAGRLAALSASAPDIATSSLLAVAAYRLQDSAATRGALLTSVERGESALWRIRFAHRPQRVVATPDGSRLAVNDNQYDVMIIDPRTRKQVGARIPTIGFLDGITADGRAVVANGPTNTQEPHWMVAAYDVPSGRRHVLTQASGLDVWFSVMTTDGRYVAVITTQPVGAGAAVQIFDSHDWTAAPRRFVTEGQPAAFAAGRTALAVEHSDGSVEVRSLASLRVVGRLAATGRPVSPGSALGVSPDGRYVARVDRADARRAVVYPVGGGGSRGNPLPTQPQSIQVLSFAPDAAEIAVGSASGSLAVYRSADTSPVAALAGHAGQLNGIAWTGSSTPTALYSVGLDGELVSWDLASGPRTVQERGTSEPLRLAALFGSFVVGTAQPPNTPNSTRQIFGIDTRTGRYASSPAGLIDANGTTEGIAQISASADGRYAVASIQTIYGPPVPVNRVEIFDLRRHRDIGHLALPNGSDFPDGYLAAVSPDGQRVYCNCSPTADRVDVFALPSGRFLKSFPVRFSGADASTVEPDCWMFDPAGRLVVFGSDPKGAHQRIGLVDLSSDRLITQADLGSVSPPTAIGWSHDRRSVALGSGEGTVRLYDAATMTPRTPPIDAEPFPVNTVSFSPDDKTLLVGGATARFFNAADLSPQGQPVSIGNGAVWAWYAADGDVRGFAPDLGRSSDGDRWFTMVAAPGKLAALACQLSGDITAAQWRTFVGDRPYRHVCPAPSH